MIPILALGLGAKAFSAKPYSEKTTAPDAVVQKKSRCFVGIFTSKSK
jgi:hypothetical protein